VWIDTGHELLPVKGQRDLNAGGHEICTPELVRRSAASSGSQDEQADTVARDRLGEAVEATFGDDDVGVVQETIDRRRGKALGEDRVEPPDAGSRSR
jgi:hypothetical protein